MVFLAILVFLVLAFLFTRWAWRYGNSAKDYPWSKK